MDEDFTDQQVQAILRQARPSQYGAGEKWTEMESMAFRLNRTRDITKTPFSVLASPVNPGILFRQPPEPDDGVPGTPPPPPGVIVYQKTEQLVFSGSAAEGFFTTIPGLGVGWARMDISGPKQQDTVIFVGYSPTLSSMGFVQEIVSKSMNGSLYRVLLGIREQNNVARPYGTINPMVTIQVQQV